MVIRPRGAKFELRIKHKLLPKLFTATFNSEVEASTYGNQLEALLARGVVPPELVTKRGKGASITIGRCISEYQAAVHVSAHDVSILDFLARLGAIGMVRVDDAMKYSWVEAWVHKMKVDENLAPGTIRKRVGAIARMLDWYLKRQAEDDDAPVLANPFRMLPKNYSTYNDHEKKLVRSAPGKEVKIDVERDRRLTEEEDQAIRLVLSGVQRPDRQRPLQLPDGDALLDLYDLIVNTGLRLREAYSLRADDVDLNSKTIFVRKSKTGVGRNVPILKSIYPRLAKRVKAAAGPEARIFPWLSTDPTPAELTKVTSLLSRAFARVFDYAECKNLNEHDLRHEATCRWVMMKDKKGGWMFRTEECMKITGHKDARVFMRYISLRGSDLADRLWS